MLTRRHIRVKVMQSIYAFTQSQNTDLGKEEKFLSSSMENMYNLYLTLLSLLVEIQKMADEQLTLSQKKYLATKEEKNPKRKFVDNPVLLKLVNDAILAEKLENRGISWELDEEYVKIIYKAILESEIYAEYLAKDTTDFKDDKKVIIDLFQKVIAPNEKLYEYIEDKKLTWVDDLPLVNTLLLKMIKKLKGDAAENYFHPSLFKDDDDKLFASLLFKKTILNDERIQQEIEGKTPNWDTDRIADLDAILLKMAICEFLKFPSIPVKVTINEYLEIAKEYSTPKSSIFINGILDKLVKEYQANNSLNKSGRGLM
ncbi:transcription antitermination factor NusB [Galbibacter mesophilus]|uniref:transcription antitermination factor NusB n=1 Tax=Galbibacter mesophilus TaxID=379069 RepID=UPI001F5D80A4|nr:transcription antitermination factor NusB [Galbibacter mesophilus]MCM5663922.1 transcription antitermination factor NusB [Galbibacter mesophilus]